MKTRLIIYGVVIGILVWATSLVTVLLLFDRSNELLQRLRGRTRPG